MSERPSSLVLRRVRADEHAAVGALVVAAYEPFLVGPDDPYRAQLAAVARRDAEAEVWVAEDAGRLVGNVTVCPPGSAWCELAGPDEGEFRMLAVDPAAQGRGVGRRLAELVVERFRADGARAVVLSSLVQMHDAHRLYERLGFVRAPERDWSPYPGTDLVAYVLSLR